MNTADTKPPTRQRIGWGKSRTGMKRSKSRVRCAVVRCRSPRSPGFVGVTGLAVSAVLLMTGCSDNSSAASTGSTHTSTSNNSSPLRRIDLAALQATVGKTAKELKIPGAVVEVRTPQGSFTAAVGTTRQGAEVPPKGDTHFRIASITRR